MTPRITSVEGNRQRLDGGSMYGNCPRPLWVRWSPPDELGRIELACRAMLVETEGRRILLETGIGAYLGPELRSRYGVLEDRHLLLENLAALGLGDEDIDVVVLSHLHFDHAGGLLSRWRDGIAPDLLFPRARFLVGRRAWERARAPHARDHASFIPELPGLLEASGRLDLVDGPAHEVLGEGFRFHTSDGHTPGLLMTEVTTADGPLVFVADLIPGAPWMHLPITMGYDRHPELLVDEKRALLGDLHARGGRVFFTHDPCIATAGVARDERGRYSAARIES